MNPTSNRRSEGIVGISVVIATCDRAQSLGALLQALTHQDHEPFEVIVVHDPRDDPTASVLDSVAGRVKVVPIGERNLSRARNVGAAASAGELVAFIDDDAVPGSGWLAQLAAAFADPDVGGAGGVVYDRDGFGLESRFPASDRLGRARLDLQPPIEPCAELFPCLHGTNQCYRRAVLEAAGGFDEAFRFLYGEVDLCARLVCAGVRLKQLDGAPVVHRRLANSWRERDGGITDPGLPAEGRTLFALRHGAPSLGERAVLAGLERDLEEALAEDGRDAYEAAARRGVVRGRELARRERRMVPLARSGPLLVYVDRRDPRPLRVCFVSRGLAPADASSTWPMDAGGVSRYSRDLADAFAAADYEVHVITASTGASSLGWEDGMWVHRLAPDRHDALDAARRASPMIVDPLENAAAVWHEVGRILDFGRLDVVSAPLFYGEGLVCDLDERVPVVTTLHTSYRRIASMHPSWAGRPDIDDALRYERATLEHARHVHALTHAALADIRREVRLQASEAVLPLGVRDPLRGGRGPSWNGGILFVGRLELRKGVDLLLDAFAKLHPSHPDARLTLVGRDTTHTENGETYRATFERRAADDPSLAAAVAFLGRVSDRQLTEMYANCDIVCAPSRYESFGLVAVEGMSFGKPIVACATGGTVEVVRDGVDGRLVPPDAEALADCLGSLLANQALRERLGKNARRRFETTYDLPIVARRIAAAYRDVAASSAGVPNEDLGARLAGVIAGLGLAAGPEADELARDLLGVSRPA